MKKIFSLALVACMAISVSAQEKALKADLTANKMKKEYKSTAKFNVADMNLTPAGVFGQIPAKNAKKVKEKAAAASADTALYVGETGIVYYGGMMDGGYSMYPTIFQPCSRDVKFENYSIFAAEEQFGWYLDGDEVSKDSDLVIPAGTFHEPAQYAPYTPSFLMESGEEYYYGIENTSSQWEYSWLAFPDFKMPMTKCQMFTTTKDIYGIGKGRNHMMWQWSDDMPYMFGSGFDYYELGYPKHVIMDSLIIPWGIDGMTTEFDTIIIPVMSANASSIAIGNDFKIAIIDVTNETIDRIDITADHIKDVELYEGDTYADLVIPVEKSIKDEFFFIISGFSKAGANIGFYSDGVDNTYTGDTYYEIEGDLYPSGMNLSVTLNAQIIEDGLQGIQGVDAKNVKAEKIFRDGQLIIKKGDLEFNVLGAQL